MPGKDEIGENETKATLGTSHENGLKKEYIF